ncbi:MAG: response regulator [Spirochaetales bacterium]|nr:response regulator [Spirochaetales bacterium]
MNRIFVVDDERPVVECVSMMVEQDLATEFAVVGAAASGREAVERVAGTSPDIVLMDVNMPGITGLEAVRELRERGCGAAFVLMTAYERFDVAREAVDLGIVGYLLKPVTREELGRTLRSAAAFLERLRVLEEREMEHRESEERLRRFVESSFLAGLMLGASGPEQAAALAELGIAGGWAAVVATSFTRSGAEAEGKPQGSTLENYLQFRTMLRFRTRSFIGPLSADIAPVLVAGRDEMATRSRLDELLVAIGRDFGAELERGYLAIAAGAPCPVEEAGRSWAEALAGLAKLGGSGTPGPIGRAEGEWPFEDDEAFLAAVRESAPARASLALERILARLERLDAVPGPELGRVTALLGAAVRFQARRSAIDVGEAESLMDSTGMCGILSGKAFALVARSRLARIAASMASSPPYSPPVARAMAWIGSNFRKGLGLEACADAVGISPGRLSRSFAEETGKGFTELLIDRRIELARELLSKPDWTIKEVSASCGYPDPNYFARLFKKATGMTPSAYGSGLGRESLAQGSHMTGGDLRDDAED